MHKTGIAWDGRGGLWGLTAYDKSVQAVAYLQKKGQGRTESGAANSVVPNNTMRVELKLLRRRAVTGLLGFELAKDLSANWAKLESVYETFLRRRLFAYAPDSLKDKRVDGLDDFLDGNGRAGKSKRSRRWMDKMFKSFGVYSLAKQYGREYLVESIMARSGLIKGSSIGSKRSRLNNELAEIELWARLKEETSSRDGNLEDLYRELYSKLLSPAT